MNSNTDIIWYIYSEYEQLNLIELKKIKDFSDYKYEKTLSYCKDNWIKFLVKTSIEYPIRIQKNTPKPYIFYYIWNIWLLEEKNKILWIVWPRQPMDFSINYINNIFDELKNYNCISVSWLANWIDTLCHTKSINNWIPTIAILGWWFKFFLKSHKWNLIKKIVDTWWLVISPFKLSVEPTKYTFPSRNWLIANIADLLLIPWAKKKSWSLITADFCYKMKKFIYWYNYNAPNDENDWLLDYINKWIITPINNITDLIKNNFIQKHTEQPKTILSQDEQKIYEYIKQNPNNNIDDMTINIWIDFWKLLAILTNLEIKWIIKQISPWIYKWM